MKRRMKNRSTQIEVNGVRAALGLRGGCYAWLCEDEPFLEYRLNRFLDDNLRTYFPQPERCIAMETAERFGGRVINMPAPIDYSKEPPDRVY